MASRAVPPITVETPIKQVTGIASPAMLVLLPTPGVLAPIVAGSCAEQARHGVAEGCFRNRALPLRPALAYGGGNLRGAR